MKSVATAFDKNMVKLNVKIDFKETKVFGEYYYSFYFKDGLPPETEVMTQTSRGIMSSYYPDGFKKGHTLNIKDENTIMSQGIPMPISLTELLNRIS